MKKIVFLIFVLLLTIPAFGIIAELDSEPFDQLDISSIKTILTHTPDASNPMLCQAYIVLGSAADPLDGTGGAFEFVMTIGGKTVQPNPQIAIFGAGDTEASIWTAPFLVPAGEEVVIQVTSPNADTSVGVTAYLFDVFPINVAAGVVESNVQLIEGGDATDALDTAADTVTVTSMANNVITTASINDGAITDADVANDVQVTLANGPHGGAVASLDLKTLDVTNADGTAVHFDGTDGPGLRVDGRGVGISGAHFESDDDVGINLEGLEGGIHANEINLILADTSAVDTTSEMRIFLTGANTPVAKDSTPLTELEIRAAVWNALTASYGGVGTYGQAVEDVLADTSAYDTDAEYAAAVWGATMENSRSYAEVMRVFAAVLSGKTSIADDEITFIGIDGVTVRLKVTVSSGARTSVDTWDGGP